MSRSDSKPKILIGMPTYNSASTIKQTINSLLNQTYPYFDLLISDNCSDDGTFEYCKDIERLDPRITVVRQNRNIGGWSNLMYLLQQCRHDYFKWNASDDQISPDFLAVNLLNLEINHGAIGSFSPDLDFSIDGQRNSNLRTHDFSGSLDERIIKFMSMATESNASFYGLFRGEVKNLWKERWPQNFLIPDWMFMFNVLSKGDVIRSPDGLMYMGDFGVSKQEFAWTRSLNTTIDKMLPYREFAKGIKPVLGQVSWRTRLLIIRFILHLHLNVLKGQGAYLKRMWIQSSKTKSFGTTYP